MTRAGQVVLALVLLPVCAPAARAAEWMLTTADFRTERVTLHGVSENGTSITGADGTRRSIDFDRMLQLERIAPAQAGGARFMLVLAGGEQIAGEPQGLENETLVWLNPTLGELRLPLSSALSISRASRPVSSSNKREAEDVITLGNGDTVRGIIASIDAGSITAQASGGDAIAVTMNSIASVEFAAVTAIQTPPQVEGRAFRVSLNDRSTVVARSILSQGQQFRVILNDSTSRMLPVAVVNTIEQINGPVVWLSSRRPVQNEQTPFLESAWPARINQTVRGNAIRFGERTFERGIGVHSHSRMIWTIDPGYEAFRTQYAIDGQLPYANVTVRIKLDDTVAHEQTDFRAGTLSPLIVLDTGAARTITLEVDYGDSFDVQDRFNWIEPALLKRRPRLPTSDASAPSTQPATEPAGVNR